MNMKMNNITAGMILYEVYLFVYFAAIAMFRNGGGVTVCHQVPRVFTKTKEQEEKGVFELSLVSSQIRLSSQSYAQ